MGNSLSDNQGAPAGSPLRAQTVAQVINDLVVQRLAMRAPTFGSSQRLHTAAQAPVTEHCRPIRNLPAQFGAEALEEKKLRGGAGFLSQMPQVCLDYARNCCSAAALGVAGRDLEAETA